MQQRRYSEAEGVLYQSLNLKQTHLGGKSYRLAFTLRFLGERYLNVARIEQARDAFAQAKALFENAIEADYPGLIPILIGLGNVEIQAKMFDQATFFLELFENIE